MGGSPKCTTADVGYSIIGGVLTKCDTTCKACSGTTSSDCTSCYDSFLISGGVCSSCSDPNALFCLSTNSGFAAICKIGYTAAYYTSGGSLQSGGTCRACSTHCKQCDINGPSNCDTGQCYTGYVVLSGTTNCTACFGSCSSCSTTDLSACSSCPIGQFLSGTSCITCATNCDACTSATLCTTCSSGYSLVNGGCVAIPVGCISMSSASTCSGCIVGYTLNSVSSGCNIDTTCNGTSTCEVCSSGQYLSGKNCLTCPSLATNCLTCDPSTPVNCFKCSAGFYLASTNTCTSCVTGCA